MNHLTLQVSDLLIRIEAEEDLLRFLHHYYDQVATEVHGHPDVLIRWRNTTCHREGHGLDLVFRAPDLRSRRFLTTCLVLRTLAEAWPDGLFFHGNALRDRETGRLLLVSGTSGGGKSTLTSRLVATERFEFLAEDLLVLRRGPTLSPFPRRASMRFWEDDQHLRTEWARVAPVATRDPIALGSPDVVLLNVHPDRPGETGPVVPTRLLLSDWEDSATEILAQREVQILLRESRPWGTELHVDRLPEGTESLGGMVAELESRGLLVLGMGVGIPDPFREHRRIERPAQPELESLSPARGFQLMLPHRLRFALPHRAETASQRFFRLAGYLSTARFWFLLPGGTPEETSHCLLEGLAQAE